MVKINRETCEYLVDVVKNGDVESVKDILDNKFKEIVPKYYCICLDIAIESNLNEIFKLIMYKYMIKDAHCIEYNYYLLKVCENGNIDLTEFILDIISKRKYNADYSIALRKAIKGNHIYICMLIIEYARGNANTIYFNCSHAASECAVIENKKLMKIFIQINKELRIHTDVNLIMRNAASSGNISIFNYTIHKLYADDYYNSYISAVTANKKEMCLYIMNNYSNMLPYNPINKGCYFSAYAGNEDLCKMFISMGATNYKHSILGAIMGKNQNLVRYFVNNEDQWLCKYDYNTALTYAAYDGYTELCELFIIKGACNIYDAIETAREKSKSETVKYLESVLIKPILIKS